MRPAFSELLSTDDELKALWLRWGELELDDEVLHRKKIHVGAGQSPVKQLVAPSKLRSEILVKLHNDRTAGHLGIAKTLSRVKARFYWPGCKRDIARWCICCKGCIQKRTAKLCQGRLGHMPSYGPFEVVAMDIVGPLPSTDNGNVFMLVICDHFTRWVEVMAITDHTAQTVADVFVTEFVCRFGLPIQIHTDQGTEFMSNLFKQMCQLLNLKQSRNTPYHPQADGLVERFNRTVQQMLRNFVNENRTD